MIDACVRTVTAEGDLDGVIPGWLARDVALTAQNALEAYQMARELGPSLPEITGSDWSLTVVAELAFTGASLFARAKSGEARASTGNRSAKPCRA